MPPTKERDKEGKRERGEGMERNGKPGEGGGGMPGGVGGTAQRKKGFENRVDGGAAE